ncbi:hypothetical protein, partial [Hyalangium versicolor]|uniref:hypothetical protein n=1 Tax=Hyalangium versicolor TaxID=2861190 RepID=UPI001CCB3106
SALKRLVLRRDDFLQVHAYIDGHDLGHPQTETLFLRGPLRQPRCDVGRPVQVIQELMGQVTNGRSR